VKVSVDSGVLDQAIDHPQTPTRSRGQPDHRQGNSILVERLV
jgi:hypothetical protein